MERKRRCGESKRMLWILRLLVGILGFCTGNRGQSSDKFI